MQTLDSRPERRAAHTQAAVNNGGLKVESETPGLSLAGPVDLVETNN